MSFLKVGHGSSVNDLVRPWDFMWRIALLVFYGFFKKVWSTQGVFLSFSYYHTSSGVVQATSLLSRGFLGEGILMSLAGLHYPSDEVLGGGWCLADHRILETGRDFWSSSSSCLLKRGSSRTGCSGPWMMLFCRQIKDILLRTVLPCGCDKAGWDKLLQIFFNLLSASLSRAYDS